MDELQKVIVSAQYNLSDEISENAQNLITGVLEKDPNKRLSLGQVLTHPWLKDATELSREEMFTEQEINNI